MENRKVIVIAGGNGELATCLIQELSKQDITICIFDLTINRNLPIEQFICDITDVMQVQDAFDKVFACYKRIDVLINMAGVHLRKPFLEIKSEELMTIIRTNIIGSFNLMQSVVPYLKSGNGGKIINLSSSAAYDYAENTSVYAMTKSALNCLTQYLANELNEFNISVYALCPTVIHTQRVDENIRMYMSQTAKEKNQIIEEYCDNLNGAKRMLQPKEMIGLIEMLMGDEKNCMTGVLFPINCGSNMRI